MTDPTTTDRYKLDYDSVLWWCDERGDPYKRATKTLTPYELLSVQTATTTDSIDREQWLEIDKLYRSMSAWQLAERLRTAEADHEKDKQAWINENTELLTQVERLTEALLECQKDLLRERAGGEHAERA